MRESVFSPGLRAVRDGLRPLLLIQFSALGLVLLYYFDPSFREWTISLQEIKSRGGIPFAALATSVSGAILPQFARLVTGRPLPSIAEVGFQFLFFAVLGTTVDLLYLGLGAMIGESASARVVTEKLLIDQFIYSPTVSIPMSAFAFLLESKRFRILEAIQSLRTGEFRHRYVTLLVTCWCFWLPVLICVYSLPSNLQFLLFLFANGAWSLLLVFISSERRPAN